jgi:hypothetical protein
MLLLLKILSIFRIFRVRLTETSGKTTSEMRLGDLDCSNSAKTFYIMGCGSSINYLSDREIEIINSSDSVGINLFIMHEEIKPTYYSVEIADTGDYGKVQNSKMYCELLKEKVHKGGSLQFIIDSSNWSVVIKMLPDILRYGRVNLTHQVPIPGQSIRHFAKLHGFLMSKYVIKLMKSGMIYGKNASVISLVYYALLRGYKNIVLCGVDLTSEYFWETEDKKNKYPGSKSFVNMHRTSLIHKTDETPLPVSVILKSINDLSPDTRIWVSSPLSRLSKDLPVFDFYE